MPYIMVTFIFPFYLSLLQKEPSCTLTSIFDCSEVKVVFSLSCRNWSPLPCILLLFWSAARSVSLQDLLGWHQFKTLRLLRFVFLCKEKTVGLSSILSFKMVNTFFFLDLLFLNLKGPWPQLHALFPTRPTY